MTGRVVIRTADHGDADPLIELRAAIAAEGVWIGAELPLDEERDRARLAAAIDAASATVLVAEIDGTIVGNVGLDCPIGIAYLGMMVADGHRGAGIGHALLDAGIDWARSVGAHKIDLDMWPWNDRAQRLYAEFGFEVEGYRRRHWRRKDGSLWDAVVMGLVLDHDSPGHDEWATSPPA